MPVDERNTHRRIRGIGITDHRGAHRHAYSVAVCDELSTHTGRSIKLGVVHSVLARLEEKGLVKSAFGDATQSRGGKRKRFYHLTAAGKKALVKTKSTRDQLWSRIPAFTWS